jgi:hypothetical protein
MRLPAVCFISLKLLIIALLAADLFSLWVWASRPPLFYSYWLGLVGPPYEAPIPRLVAWAAWENGPRTPSGCLALFEIGELFFAGVLLFALFLLTVILLARRQGAPLWRLLSAPFSLAKAIAIRFRVRTALAAIAIIGLYLGWEVHAWRTWQLRSFYLHKRDEAAGQKNYTDALFKTNWELHAREDQRNASPLADEVIPALGYYRSKASLRAEKLAHTEMWRHESAQLTALRAAYAQRKRKYERAADDPWMALPPDEPLPEPVLAVYRWEADREYARALAAFDELALAYPDFVDAHLSSARIRATCRDPQFRDGKLALASATRACELTNWKDVGALGTMAAAAAEMGRFAEAVKWQQTVVSLTPRPQNGDDCRERLDLYRSGQPYRQK